MIKLSFYNLLRRKTRTALSLIGIVIGVTAIMSLVSVVDGLQSEFDTAVSSIQAVLVQEKGSIDQTISFIDADLENDLKNIKNVRVVVPEVWRIPFSVEGKPNSLSFEGGTLAVYGIDLIEFQKLRNPVYSVNIKKGRFVKPGEKGAVVIGETVADRFNKFVGNKLKINGESFTIVGIYVSDSPLFETVLAMDIGEARRLFEFSSDKVSSFYIEPIRPELDKKVRQEIEFRFEEEVDARTSGDFSDTFGGVLGNFRLVVFFIAGISGLVAGIGIINTILMSVLERRKEIGALKAVGWTSFEVIKMILYESFLIGVLGGVIGVIFGFIGAFLLENLFGLTVEVTFLLVIEAFLFAVVIGVLAGIYPAMRASKLDPVQALSD
ncbi:MAG TPA: ABC transporter permease [archaeon]|nr:ABC transporter permease [archaeon]